jgi:hypothetical protein
MDVVMRIPDKARYQRWTKQEWTPALSRTVRTSLLSDPDWGAFRARRGGLRLLLTSLVSGALQAGYLATHDQIEENIERIPGVEIDWPVSRKRLAQVGRHMVGGFRAAETAGKLWDAAQRTIDGELRQSFRKSPGIQAASRSIREACRSAQKALLDSVDVLIGDAVCDGQRAALQDFGGIKGVIGK